MQRAELAAGEGVEAVEAVHLSQLVAGDRTSVQGFEIEPGATVPEHSHEHEQAGFLHAGRLVFHVGGGEAPEERVVGPGDAYVIPGGEPHAVTNRGDEPAVGVDVFAPPRADPHWAE